MYNLAVAMITSLATEICGVDFLILHFNEAGYTATPVACGWAGAEFELLEHLGRSSEAKDHKNKNEVKWRPTDRPMDGHSGL